MSNNISKFLFQKIGIPDHKKYLDLASLRHKLISGNIANSTTPGFRAQDIDFEKEFAKATSNSSHLSGTTTNSSHIPLGQHKNKPPDVEGIEVKEGDMNSVNIDNEISNLAVNELRFTIGARLMQKKFEGLKKAITSK